MKSSKSSSVSKKTGESINIFFWAEKARKRKTPVALYISQTRYCICTNRVLINLQKTEAAIVLKRASRYRCVPKIASPETEKSKTYYSTIENSAGHRERNRRPDFGFCYPATPLVFADASLRTHKDKLVGKTKKT